MRQYTLTKKPYPDSPTIIRHVLGNIHVPPMSKKDEIFLYVSDDMIGFIDRLNAQGYYHLEYVNDSDKNASIVRFDNPQYMEID